MSFEIIYYPAEFGIRNIYLYAGKIACRNYYKYLINNIFYLLYIFSLGISIIVRAAFTEIIVMFIIFINTDMAQTTLLT